MSERHAVAVRRARPEDLEAVGEITVAAYAEFTEGPEDGYIALLGDAARRDREAELWVAEIDGVVVGSVTIAPLGSAWREIAADDEGEFRMLSVSPTARRRGVGDALARLVDDHFRDLGCRGIVLSSLAQMTSAHRIYERLGYHRVPERDWSPAPGVDLLAFAKEL
ncbi:acetyltransferase [Nocardioides sp. Root1257]|uniref:GNAT family N-acetyltransferase n=1 Tax=unclassified Nocardioides TaxID=2615069 RepID=UPI0006FFCE69|nr:MULTISPECIES: GNAT family N-acetyltransferase [unclassified Nocardioides]KQW48396.1 acetyltransferase [Nocardioides sp. Root1257]KRC47570.1 acetyltransferase [Nocardioides sp. Root224]